MSTKLTLVAPVVDWSISESKVFIRWIPAAQNVGNLSIWTWHTSNPDGSNIKTSGNEDLIIVAGGERHRNFGLGYKLTVGFYLHVLVTVDGADSQVVTVPINPHMRSQVRNAVSVLLDDALTAGVYVDREMIIQDSEYPALVVRTPVDEPLYDEAEMGCAPRHALTVQVEGYVKSATGDIAADLDQLAVDVETAIYTEPSLFGLVEAIALSTQEIETDQENDTPIGLITMLFTIFYRAAEGAPTVKF